MSYDARAGAVLYARDMDRVATFYSKVLGLEPADRDDEHVVLESPGFQLVVLRSRAQASAAPVAGPAVRRAEAAIKLVFFVPSIAQVRTSAEAHGGVLNGPEREWRFDGWTVCDGLDPEGNVLQFRERAG